MISGLFLVSISSLLVWVGTAPKNAAPKPEHMTEQEAMWFPVMGSIVLVSLFLALKFVPAHILNMALCAVFMVTGTFTVFKSFHKLLTISKDVVQSSSPNRRRQTEEDDASSKPGAAEERKPSSGKKKEAAETKMRRSEQEDKNESNKADSSRDANAPEVEEAKKGYFGLNLRLEAARYIEMLAHEMDFTTLLLLTLSLIVNIVYFKKKHWIISNVIASSFCITGLGEMKLDSTKTGVCLLTLLFFYDIFWVFCTPVMISVAKGIDLPIKIVFPSKAGTPSMIGLGDIVVPGLYLGIVRDFGRSVSTRFFFYAGYFGYIMGLCITFLVALQLQKGQPALLYLCPAVLLTTFGAAFFLNRHKEMFNYKMAHA